MFCQWRGKTSNLMEGQNIQAHRKPMVMLCPFTGCITCPSSPKRGKTSKGAKRPPTHQAGSDVVLQQVAHVKFNLMFTGSTWCTTKLDYSINEICKVTCRNCTNRTIHSQTTTITSPTEKTTLPYSTFCQRRGWKWCRRLENQHGSHGEPPLI